MTLLNNQPKPTKPLAQQPVPFHFPTLLYLGLAMAVLLAGIVLRFVPMGLPFAVVKWGGSVLWAVMVYWFFAAFLPTRSVWTVIGVAGVAATLVELVRLYHSPALDAFRLTLAGALLLGRVFSRWHIVWYWVGVLGTGLVDWGLIRRRNRV